MSVSWPEMRARFPVLEHHAYLNAGTFGPLARSTVEAISRLRAWEAEHGRGGRAYFEEMLATRERVRALLAGQIHVPAGSVALTESTTQGVHVVVIGLGLGPGDDVVTTDAEHFGLTGPLLAAGARLQIAKVRDARADDVFDLIRAQITPKTRLIATSAVSVDRRDDLPVARAPGGVRAAGARPTARNRRARSTWTHRRRTSTP